LSTGDPALDSGRERAVECPAGNSGEDPPMRKVIVYIATSADGYIARPDGSVDWLNRPPVPGHYGYAAFMKSIDTILWGRKTYDIAMATHGGGDGGSGKDSTIANYVFSRRPKASAPGNAQFVTEPIPQFMQKLRMQPGKDLWMMGGGEIIASFLDCGEIDQFLIHVIPTLIGEGIPLIAPGKRGIELDLLGTKKYSDGVVRLHYAVVKAAPKKRVAHEKTAKKKARAARR
jgi:dihydrofolate reductase